MTEIMKLHATHVPLTIHSPFDPSEGSMPRSAVQMNILTRDDGSVVFEVMKRVDTVETRQLFDDVKDVSEFLIENLLTITQVKECSENT